MTRFLILIGLLGTAAPAVASSADVVVEGFASLRGGSVTGPSSWLEGGFGRFPTGDGDDFVGSAHFTLEWQAANHLGFYLHGSARTEPSDTDTAGIVEAYLFSQAALGAGEFHFQLGHFILPTSRENVEVGWSSPYTLTFSALNSWIGEEVRLTGVLADYDVPTPSGSLRFSFSVFGGNDSSGALLAWRGWAMNDRLSVFDETLPLPPLDSLAPGGPFEVQLGDGTATRPFGEDLDGRAGWASSIRWSRDDRAVVQVTRFDSRGDKAFHDQSEYAWHTRFDLIGGTFELGPHWSLLGEYATGSTGMGDPLFAHVKLDFEAWYSMISGSTERFRVSLRYDDFETVDRDFSAAEINDEMGSAWTLAGFWQVHPSLRVGIEAIDQHSSRPAALESGFDPETSGRSVQLELRYSFGN